jgi:hypothetical protein
MPNEYLIKAGSIGEGLIFVMEGQAVMLGLDADIVSILRPGAHFHNNVGEDEKESSCPLSYYGRRIFHLVSQSQTTIGMITESSIQKLFDAFPDWKKKVLFLNKHT